MTSLRQHLRQGHTTPVLNYFETTEQRARSDERDEKVYITSRSNASPDAA
jgi:hypothetical protein